MKKSLMFKNALRQVRHGFNRPFMVMFETTLHCNMKCGYCAIWQNQQPEERAMRDRVFARMDEAADFGVFAWSFSGGEPLMNPNVPDYIEYAAEKGFFTSMPTNGLALKKYASSCAKLDQLEVSIDTLDREKFAKRRGIDGLPTILAALDPHLADLTREEASFQFGIRYARQVEFEYEVTTASATATRAIADSFPRSLTGQAMGAALLDVSDVTEEEKTVHGTLTVPVARYNAWLAEVFARTRARRSSSP